MKLEPPLLNLVNRCLTICEPECCGVDAYDFSPIHIASYLTMYRGEIDNKDVTDVKNQLETLKTNYGSSGISSHGVTIDEMDQCYSGEQIDVLVDEILVNLNIAIELVRHSENKRYKSA